MPLGGLVLALATGLGTATAAAPSSAPGTRNVDATARSEQRDASNESFSVATYEPRGGGIVTQENTSAASAISANEAESSSDGPCEDGARAAAMSTQTGASNTNASVRVSSRGDNGAVSQTNSSEATATASCTASQEAHATQNGARNANASVRVFSDGTNGGVTQANTAGGSEMAPSGQTDQQNINVSIRVKSAGSDGPVSQTGGSTATNGSVEAKGGARALRVSVERDGQNVDVAIVVDSDALPPLKAGEFWLWKWEWPWEGDPSQMPDWDAIAASLDGWTWDFGNPTATSPVGRPVVEKASPASGIEAGTWKWDWDFTENGRPIDWTWKESLAGCNCAWIWTWKWAWAAKNDGSAPQTGATNPRLPQADQDSERASRSITQSNSSSSLAQARNESTVEEAGQSSQVDQSAAASADSTQVSAYNSAARLGRSGKQARSSAARAIAANTSSLNRSSPDGTAGGASESAQVVQNASAVAVSSGGSRNDSANAQARNLSELEQTSHVAPGDSAVDAVLCTSTAEVPATCSRRNEASVKQTAEASGDAVARNASRLEQSNEIGRLDVLGGGAAPSSADVCNADGPTTNCAQANTAVVGQEAVGADDGASARNEAEVRAANQIAGRDASPAAGAGSEDSAGSVAGVCNAGGDAVNCRQENSVQIDEQASARGGTSVEREAEVLAVNQLAGRDTTAGATRAVNGGVSSAGVCNAGGPTINCTQENRVELSQHGYPESRRGSAERADVRAVNQIAGRDASAATLRGSDQSGVSSAGVCNAGGPTKNCTQANAVTIAQEAGRGGRAWAENEALNQITGRDAYGSAAHSVSQSRDSSAGVCNVGGETTTCTQKNAVEIAQEARGADRPARLASAEVEAANQIAGRDTAIGSSRTINRTRDSFAGVCNGGGPLVDCTQVNSAQVGQGPAAAAARGRSVENEADVELANAIAGRDTAVGTSRLVSQSRDSFAGVCNAGGPAINCTQENSVRAPQAGGARGSAENDAEVAAANQLAGRDAFRGAARVNNRHRDSSAGVCNAGGEITNCTQSNSVVPEPVAGSRSPNAEGEVIAVSQLAGRDAYAGSTRVRNRSLDTSIDLCSSDGEATDCAQKNSVVIDRAGVVRAIQQIAGRGEYGGARASRRNGGPR